MASGLRTIWRERSERRGFDAPDDARDALEVPLSTAELGEDRPQARRQRLADPVTALAFSPDGKRVLVAYLMGNLELFEVASGKPVAAFRGHAPWTDEDLWEATLLARQLGLRMDPAWPRVPEFVDPLQHLAALDGRLPDGVIQGASRARLRLLRNASIARRGGSFESPLLRSLLSGAGYGPSASYTQDRLTAIDRDNILRIKRRERALGGPLSDRALRAELAAFGVERPF